MEFIVFENEKYKISCGNCKWSDKRLDRPTSNSSIICQNPDRNRINNTNLVNYRTKSQTACKHFEFDPKVPYSPDGRSKEAKIEESLSNIMEDSEEHRKEFYVKRIDTGEFIEEAAYSKGGIVYLQGEEYNVRNFYSMFVRLPYIEHSETLGNRERGKPITSGELAIDRFYFTRSLDTAKEFRNAAMAVVDIAASDGWHRYDEIPDKDVPLYIIITNGDKSRVYTGLYNGDYYIDEATKQTTTVEYLKWRYQAGCHDDIVAVGSNRRDKSVKNLEYIINNKFKHMYSDYYGCSIDNYYTSLYFTDCDTNNKTLPRGVTPGFSAISGVYMINQRLGEFLTPAKTSPLYCVKHGTDIYGKSILRIPYLSTTELLKLVKQP